MPRGADIDGSVGLPGSVPGHGAPVRANVWKAVSLGAAVGAAALSRRAVEAAWRKQRGRVPPENPAAAGVTWTEALAWGIATGIGAAIARVFARRGAAAAWQAVTHERPPGLDAGVSA